ncbi:hypothetical protein K474DRAFT_1066112 [Panus rudis PR-1116 ss-1]|nr:hypothetical protein K474DRAFT_1066112 [Panus rudis PR-1116 ss-1]
MLWTSLPVQTLALATLSLAAPLDKPTNSNPPSSPYVVLALCVPFLLLASAKLVYLKYRRARTIHSYDTVVASASNDCKESQDPWSGLGIIASISRSSLQRDCSSQECSDSGYLVGCFGSPHWETRIVSRAGKCTRQTISLFSGRTGRNITAPPATYTSRPARRPTAIAQSRQYSTISSKAASVSFLEMQSPQLDITICGNVHPSSPPCDDNFNGVPLLTEPKRATKFKGKCSPNLSPVTVHIEQTRISVFDEPLCANYEGILPYSRSECGAPSSYHFLTS